MNDNPIEPLDDDLSATLEASRRGAQQASDSRELAAKERAWMRFLGAVSVVPVVANPPIAQWSSPFAARAGSVGAKYGLVASLGLVVGGAVGVIATRPPVAPVETARVSIPNRTVQPRAVPVLSPVLIPTPAGTSTPAEATAAPTSAQAPDSRANRPAHGANAPRAGDLTSSRSRLQEEQTLIDVARAALQLGNTQIALDTVVRHQRKFPRGELTEERESVRILALIRLGRIEDAHRLAERFAVAYPRSMFNGVISRALKTPP